MKRSRSKRFYVGVVLGVAANLVLGQLLPQVDHPSDQDVVFGVLGLVGMAVVSGLAVERFWGRGVRGSATMACRSGRPTPPAR